MANPETEEPVEETAEQPKPENPYAPTAHAVNMGLCATNTNVWETYFDEDV